MMKTAKRRLQQWFLRVSGVEAAVSLQVRHVQFLSREIKRMEVKIRALMEAGAQLEDAVNEKKKMRASNTQGSREYRVDEPYRPAE